MKRMLLVLSAMLLVTLSACSPYIPQYMMLNETPPAIVPSNTMATLVVSREWTVMYGSGADVNVFLDEDFIGQTTMYSYFIKQVKPGTHYIYSYAVVFAQAAPISTVKFDFKAGKVYYLRHSVREPPLAFTTFTTTEAIAPADANLADLKYLEFNSNPGAVVLTDEDRKAAKADFDNNPDKYQDILSYKGF